jgi:hypothetical protein
LELLQKIDVNDLAIEALKEEKKRKIIALLSSENRR